MKYNIEDYLKKEVKGIDKELLKFLPKKLDKKWVDFMAYKPEYTYDFPTVENSIITPLWDFLERGGKRWRPALMLLACDAVGGNSRSIKEFVVLPELIHNGCLTEDTLIWTSDRIPKRIVDIAEGEKVLSVSSEGKIVEQKVVKKHDNGIAEILQIKSHNREIKTTKNHPFLVVVKNQPVKFQITSFGRLDLETRLARSSCTISEFCDSFGKSHTLDFSSKHMKNALYGYGNCLLPCETAKEVSELLGLNFKKCWQERVCTYEKPKVEFIWKKAEELKKSDLLVITKELFDEDGELPKMPALVKNSKDRNIIPEEFSPELAQLAGFLLGDGYIDSGRTVFCVPKKSFGRKEYEDLIELVFSAKPSSSMNSVTICSKSVSEFFSLLGLSKGALKKTVPDWVFRLPRRHKMSFIKGYLDSDGTVTKKGTTVFECASKDLIVKLKFLLDSLGFVTGNISQKTMDNTHFARPVKKPETILYSVRTHSPNKVLLEIGTEINEYKTRLSRQLARTVSLRHESMVPSLPEGFSEETFGFSKVYSIESAGKEKTYDIQVENTHNYISNGVVTHNTIIVDDVEDNSLLRRGKPTLHITYGLDIAVNAGNAVYFLPLKIIEKFRLKKKITDKKAIEIYEAYTEELIRLSVGQGMDIYWHRGNVDTITEEQYLQMCVYKTGSLAKLSAKLGAILGNARPLQIKALGDFAASIGVAFQIHDDILNIRPPEAWGKEAGDDISEGKRTLLVIYAIKHTTPEKGKRLVEILDMHTTEVGLIKEAIAIIEETGAIEHAASEAKTLVETSWAKVDKEIKKGKAKDMLRAFADYLVERKI